MRKNKKGFTLIELMVVIAIIAILAAVALPIYSTFKKKARASKAIKGAMGVQQALQTHFDDTFDFSNVAFEVAPGVGEGAKLVDTGTGLPVGTGLPGINDVTWTALSVTTSQIDIEFTVEDCGTNDDCSGKVCLECIEDNDSCEVAVNINSDDLGLDKGDTTTMCP